MASVEITAVQIRDLEFAARRGLQRGGEIHDVAVIEVKTSHRVAGSRRFWLFLETDGPARGVKLNHAVALGILHRIGKDDGALLKAGRTLQLRRKGLTVEDVVAENKRAGLTGDKLAADEKGLCQSVGAGLNRIADINAPVMAVAQQLSEPRRVLRC